MKKLYVGNIAYSTTENALRDFFADYNPVSVRIITDKFSGQSRGFGFVEIEDDAAAEEAVSTLNGQSLDGKNLTINEARPMASSGGARSGGQHRSFDGGNRGPRSSFGGGDRRRSSSGNSYGGNRSSYR